MEPFEVMVSESQERMLCVVEPRNVEAVLAVCEKWEVERRRDRHRHRQRADACASRRTSCSATCRCERSSTTAPSTTSHRPSRPSRSTRRRGAVLDRRGASPQRDAARRCSASPNLASRRPLFEQYDSIVGSRTIRRPEQADAAVLALPDGSALAVSIDCNGRRVAADPRRGTIAAVLECAANLACVGAEPLGTTNNLNFGNPEKPHIAWQLTESVAGLGEACRAPERADRRRQRLALQRGRHRADLPDARDRHGRPPARRRPRRAARVRQRRRRARPGRAVRPIPGGLGAGQAARPAAARRPARDRPRRRRPRRSRPCATPSGRAALSSAHDVAEGGVAIALAESAIAGRLGAAGRARRGPLGVARPGRGGARPGLARGLRGRRAVRRGLWRNPRQRPRAGAAGARCSHPREADRNGRSGHRRRRRWSAARLAGRARADRRGGAGAGGSACPGPAWSSSHEHRASGGVVGRTGRARCGLASI